MMTGEELWHQVHSSQDRLLAFAQRLIQTHSLSGQEEEAARLVVDEMAALGYDEAFIDGAGNAVGRLRGGAGPSLMLNGHLDHVDGGDPEQWPHPPFAAQVHDGELWGRASVDMKGAMAAMVFAGGLLKKSGVPLPGDLYVSGTVQEEVGGLGARYLSQRLSVDRVIVGESSGNQLRRGHRGRVEIVASFEGRSVHASMPHLGVNPHVSMARFIQGLADLPMAADAVYGGSSVAPTRVTSEPPGANVTPAALRLVLDWRNVPGEEPEAIVAKLEAHLRASLAPPCRGHIDVATKELVSYTGVRLAYRDAFPSFTTAPEHPWLAAAQSTLVQVLQRPVETGIWRFATDGGHFAAAGATVIGLGPGDDALVHTVQERLPVAELIESAVAYMALALL